MSTDVSADRIPIKLRAEALEQLLVERGLVDPNVMDSFIRPTRRTSAR